MYVSTITAAQGLALLPAMTPVRLQEDEHANSVLQSRRVQQMDGTSVPCMPFGKDFLGDHLGQLLGRHRMSRTANNSANSVSSTEQKYLVARVDEECGVLGAMTLSLPSYDGDSEKLKIARATASIATKSSQAPHLAGPIGHKANLSSSGIASKSTYKSHGSPASEIGTYDDILHTFFAPRTTQNSTTTPSRGGSSSVADNSAKSSQQAGGDDKSSVHSKKSVNNQNSALHRRSSTFVYPPKRRPRPSSSSSLMSPTASNRADLQSDISDTQGEKFSCDIAAVDSKSKDNTNTFNELQTPSDGTKGGISTFSSLNSYSLPHLSASRRSFSTPPTIAGGDNVSTRSGENWLQYRNGSVDAGVPPTTPQGTYDDASNRAVASTNALHSVGALAWKHFRDGGIIEPPEADRDERDSTSLLQASKNRCTAPPEAVYSTPKLDMAGSSSRFTSMSSTRSISLFPATQACGIPASTDDTPILYGSGISDTKSSTSSHHSSDSKSRRMGQAISISTSNRGVRLVPKALRDGGDGRTFIFVPRTPPLQEV